MKKFKLSEVNFEHFFSGPHPTFVKSKPKKIKKPKEKSAGVIDLTGEDEFIKQIKKERKEQKQAVKKKEKGWFKYL